MKVIKKVLALALVVVMGASLVSCDINPITFWQEKIAPLSHEHEVVIDRGVEPGCVFGGLTEGSHCSTCGEVFKAQEELPALGHDLRHNKCLGCDRIFESQGLRYEVLDSERCYITGMGDCTDKDLYIPEYIDGYRVVSIAAEAFNFNRKITSVYIPESVEFIAWEAFRRCENLEKVTLSEGLEEIYHEAFWDCESLTSIVIPGSVTEIGYMAFEFCEKLESVELNDGVEIIGSSAFNGCTSLSRIVIPDSVTSIGSRAFDRSNIVSATIPLDAISHIPTDNLETLIITSGTTIEDGTFLDCNSLTSVEISYGLSAIGASAFKGCGNLASIVIPDSVTSIGDEAFCDCVSLASITIPSSVTSIGYSAFEDCSSLTSVVIPNGVTSIEKQSFVGCSSLTSVVIPDSVIVIGNYAFSWCEGLTSIKFEGTTAQWNSISKGKEWNAYSGNCIVYCIDGTVTK